jgi:hypothetical protein
MSEVQAEIQAQGEDVQAYESTPQQDIIQYQQQQQQVVESVEPNVVVILHLPDINKDLEIGKYIVKSAWIKVKISPTKGAMVYKLTLLCNGEEYSFEALSIFIEFKDKVVFRLTR